MELPIYPNLSNVVGTLGQPWLFNPGVEALQAMRALKKRRRREYLQTPQCGWCLTSPAFGEIPNRRISNDLNEVRSAGAFICDYDAPVSPAMREQYLLSLSKELRPTYIDTTLGGNLCAMWVFEHSIPFSGNTHYSETLREFAKLVGAETLFPGFDRASYNATQVYTTGAQFEVTGGLLRADIVEGLAVKAFQRVCKKEASTINIELVAQEIENRYPGRWQGEFKIGAVGVRFWDDNADNKRGAMVMEDGIYCLTGDRAFIRWEDPVLLGRAWVAKHQALQYANAAENIFFDDKMYWRQLPSGDWVEATEPNIKLELRFRGLCSVKDKGDTMSQVDEVVHYIQSHKRVVCAIPLLYRRPGVIDLEGERVLNISNIKVIQPIDVTDLCKTQQ